MVQIAYLVSDVRAAALSHHAAFGSGPYFVADHIELAEVTHRGLPAVFDHSSAYGQWGEVMVEFVCVHAAEPSGLAEAVSGSTVRPPAPGSPLGPIHHLARFVEDVDGEAEYLDSCGFAQIMAARTGSGQLFAFHDGGPMGHLLEIYSPTAGLLGFYRRVADAAAGWAGDDVIRPM